MTCYLVELYTPNNEWKALSDEQRQQFLHGIQAAMSGLSSQGIEILSLTQTDQSVDNTSPHRFLGIWRFPDVSMRNILLSGIQASGWYQYFDHINAATVDEGGLPSHLKALAQQ